MPAGAGAPAVWPDVAVLERPEPSSVVPIPAAIPFVCHPRPDYSRKNPRRSGEGSGHSGLRRQRLSLCPASRREPVMSTNTRSIPISSERSRPRRDTSTRPRSSAGTCTRRPSALMAMATRLRFRLLNRPNVVLRKLTPTGPYSPWCSASVPAEVKLCATPHSGRVAGEVSPARRDTETQPGRRHDRGQRRGSALFARPAVERPPGPLADERRQGRDEQASHHEGVDQHAQGHG